MQDNSLATHCKDVHGKPKLIKEQANLSFSTSPSSGSKSKKSKQDNYDNIESRSEMDTDNVSEKKLSPIPGSLPRSPEKRLKEEEVVTAELSRSSVAFSHAFKSR